MESKRPIHTHTHTKDMEKHVEAAKKQLKMKNNVELCIGISQRGDYICKSLANAVENKARAGFLLARALAVG